jgi:flagellar hook-associated protein 3 FlgL
MTSIVTTLSTFTAAKFRRETVADVQGRLEKAGTEMSTGRKADVHADLGLRSAELMALRASADRNESFLTGNQILSGKLDVMAATMSGVRETLQDFLEVAVSNRGAPGPTISQVRDSARAAYDQIVAQLNTTYQGAQLFAGTESARAALQSWDQPDAVTGFSPSGVMAGIVALGLNDAVEATARAAQVALVFDSANAVAPETNFEATFYNGTPLGGTPPSPRLSARIDEATVVDFGIQANDPPFVEALKGLAMFAAADPATLSDAGAYTVWVDAAISAVVGGIDRLVDTEARFGVLQKTVEDTIARQTDRGDLYGRHIALLETVDPYEAATRVTELSTQLEAAYTVTARISRLTFLDYM